MGFLRVYDEESEVVREMGGMDEVFCFWGNVPILVIGSPIEDINIQRGLKQGVA